MGVERIRVLKKNIPLGKRKKTKNVNKVPELAMMSDASSRNTNTSSLINIKKTGFALSVQL